MQIDVFYDTVCPWCWIGKRHLALALEQWQGDPVSLRYHSFFLNPDIPPQGYDFAPYMLQKGGGRMSLEDFFAGPRQMGAAIGIDFRFEAIQRAPNTTDSHRLMMLAPDALKDPLLEALFAAYFHHGQDLSDHGVLLSVAQTLGLDLAAVREMLAGDQFRAEVALEMDIAAQIGVRGVPFYVFHNKFAFSGAQPPETILRVMQQTADMLG
jgi:predicted DsbA family dithiol-disulfide isomerase